MEKEQKDFLVISGKEFIESFGLKDTNIGNEYVLVVTSCKDGEVVLNFKLIENK